MKQLLITIAAVVLVGCGESQKMAPAPESKPVEPVAEATKPEPPTAKVPDISIYDAAEDGNIEAVKQHLAAGTDVNTKYRRGKTLLHRAIANGYKEIFELLIAKGADVNAKDDDEWTPLHLAAIDGYKEIAEVLIAKGADVNAKNDEGWTSLQVTAFLGQKGQQETAELLIAEGVDVNAKDVKGQTPLDWAILNTLPEIADLLRKHGGKTGEELKAEGK